MTKFDRESCNPLQVKKLLIYVCTAVALKFTTKSVDVAPVSSIWLPTRIFRENVPTLKQARIYVRLFHLMNSTALVQVSSWERWILSDVKWTQLWVTKKFLLQRPALQTFFSRVARFFLAQNTKTGKNIPGYHKIPIPNGHGIFPMPVKQTKWS
jgi:hypothetical protein